MIVYFQDTKGLASDFRFEKESYELQAGEKVLAADEIPRDIKPYHSLPYLRKLVKGEAKAEARLRLETDFPDWKVIRHLEEKDAGGNTSLTPQEYSKLGQARKAVRDASDSIESEVDGKSKTALLGLDVSKHSAWPAQG